MKFNIQQIYRIKQPKVCKKYWTERLISVCIYTRQGLPYQILYIWDPASIHHLSTHMSYMNAYHIKWQQVSDLLLVQLES